MCGLRKGKINVIRLINFFNKINRKRGIFVPLQRTEALQCYQKLMQNKKETKR